MIPSLFALASHLGREPAEHDGAGGRPPHEELAVHECAVQECAGPERQAVALAPEPDRVKLQASRLQPQPRSLAGALYAVSAIMATDVAAAGAILTALGDLLRAPVERMDPHEALQEAVPWTRDEGRGPNSEVRQ